jgi:hypothetical protein
MSLIKKTLFDENIEKYNVFINDTTPFSEYFKITELNDTFTGGKNAFLIQGSEQLVSDSIIKLQIRDAKGDIIYYEPGEGIVSSSINGESFVSEYYEGVSKVVSVYIYPDTAYGPCTITILGEISSYNSNGLILPIPSNWEGQYNVKWQKQINVNPGLANTTKIRFYKRPSVKITELLQPLYTINSGTGLKVDSGVSQSFADIKLSNLETFAGDVKRVKVFRTSQGDISDYDLIQDVLLESKELLTTYGLTGSVIGNTGIFTGETLQKYWNTGSLYAELTSSRIESGLKLSGSGILRYTSSLDINSANTYELNLKAFYSGTVDSNLGIYLESGSVSSSIGTLYGISPTKNFSDVVIPFSITQNYPSASLYFSQSNGEWHLGNISLKLSQDTAFSPDSISFVTTMPTILGNDVFNFKFEFYDLNNNYVPVFVTQSATFVGTPTSVINTTFIISSSVSQSNAVLYAVSSSISGTMTTYSSSASGSLGIVSGSVFNLSGSVSTSVLLLTSSISSSLSSSFGFTSSSVYTLSSSVSSSTSALSSSISRSVYNSLTQSFAYVQRLADGNYSGSFISGNIIYAPVIGGQLGYFSTLFKVGQSPNSIYLDARQAPRKIFIGGAIPGGDTEYSGAYNNTNTNVYLDSSGKFSLADKLSFDGSNLSVNGTINVTGGNAATDTNALLYAARAAASASISGSSALSAADRAAASASISASAAQTAASADATSKANIAIVTSAISASNAALSASNAFTNAKAVADSIANGTYSGGTLISATSIISPVIAGADGYISNVLKVGSGGITLDGTNKAIYVGTGTYNNANTPFYFASGSAGANLFSLGDKLTWNGSTLSITGTINVTGGNAATDANALLYSQRAVTSGSNAASTAQSNAISTAAGDATTKANNAQSNAISTAAGDATTKANAAYTNATAQLQILADGGYSGSFIGSTTIYSPNIGGQNGYISNILKVGQNGITLDGGNKKIYVGTGTYNNANTPFYFASGSTNIFSLGDKLTFNGSNLGVSGSINATGGAFTGFMTAGTAKIGKGVSGTEDGIYLDGYNYWFTDSGAGTQFKFGTSVANISYNSSFGGPAAVATSGVAFWVQSSGTNPGTAALTISDGGLKVYNTLTANSGYAIDCVGSLRVNNNLQVGGSGSFTGDIISQASDKRLKENITTITSALDKVDKINGVYFNFTNEANKLNKNLTKNKQVGFLAQEIQSVLPEIVKPAPFDIGSDGNSISGENYLTIQYEKVVPLLLQAIKELKFELDEIKKLIK